MKSLPIHIKTNSFWLRKGTKTYLFFVFVIVALVHSLSWSSIIAIIVAYISMHYIRWLKVFSKRDKTRRKFPKLRCPTQKKIDDEKFEVDMDFLPLTYLQFIVSSVVIYPALMAAFFSNSFKFLMSKKEECDYLSKVAELHLETTTSLKFYGWEDDNKIAIFQHRNIPLLMTNKKTMTHYELIEYKIDVISRRMVSATLDGVLMSPEDAFCVLLMMITYMYHPVLHCFANWGFDTTPNYFSTFECISISSVLYNHYGFIGMVDLMGTFCDIGIVGKGAHEYLQYLFAWRNREGFYFHNNSSQLMPYSAFLSFLFKIRPIFLREFERCQRESLLPASIHSEGMFLGSLVHSIDHATLENVTHDLEQISYKCEDFKLMSDMIKAGLVMNVDLPGVMLTATRYKDSSHPLFRRVYEMAVEIDPWFADRMDTCIIK